MLRNLTALISAAILLILGFMFSVVLLVVVAVLGLGFWGYLWWKTRGLRRATHSRTHDNTVIEGEAIVVEEDLENANKVLPDHDNQR